MAIHPKDRLPRVQHIPIRFVRFSGAALTQGLAVHEIEKVSVTLTTPAKTVADCFKYRNKIGIDVAVEALRDCLTTRGRHGALSVQRGRHLALRRNLSRGERDAALPGRVGMSDSLAASVRQRLLNVSRARGDEFQLLLTHYAIERLLYRLSQSAAGDRFLLKGAMLFNLWTEHLHRPTRDLDLSGEGSPSAE